MRCGACGGCICLILILLVAFLAKIFPEESSSGQVSPAIIVSGPMYWCS